MRVLIFHGYLLSGTGSNVYNASLAQALVGLGHEAHLLTQDRQASELPFVDAVGDWDTGALRLRTLREPVRCTVYRPNIGSLLPVYVKDRYEGLEARTFLECRDEEIAFYVEANVAAVRELAVLLQPHVALANHLVMGPVILARGLADTGVPYAVKVHGSALEYTVKPDPERFLGYAREGLQSARGILVGSHHTAASLWRALDDPDVTERTRLGPPGVDVGRFRPLAEDDDDGRRRSLAGLAASLRAQAPRPSGERSSSAVDAGAPVDTAAVVDAAASVDNSNASAFQRDGLAAAEALERLLALTPASGTTGPPDKPLVAFVGKLIVSKGVDLLVAAWPLVLERVPGARLVVVGFGAYREGLERLLGALADGDLAQAIDIARVGRALEGGPSAPLRHLLAFLEGLSSPERERYLAGAAKLRDRVVFTGRLDHDELAEVLPACDALVVPSTFPEAFGMVAAEGAACGALPVSAGHSGLAEVSHALARAVPPEVAGWLSFPVDDGAVPALAERVAGWLEVDPELRARARAGMVQAVRDLWSWEGVARDVVAAAQGELEALPRP
jgi:glycosyltransferase involved in cell wall biosynthesis